MAVKLGQYFGVPLIPTFAKLQFDVIQPNFDALGLYQVDRWEVVGFRLHDFGCLDSCVPRRVYCGCHQVIRRQVALMLIKYDFTL